MYTASCLCGAIKLELSAEPVKASHCYCTMCQKQHGAAFASYASFYREHVRYLQGEELLSTFYSSADVARKFCQCCGSNIEWYYSKQTPDRVAIALGLFDKAFSWPDMVDLHIEDKPCWL